MVTEDEAMAPRIDDAEEPMVPCRRGCGKGPFKSKVAENMHYIRTHTRKGRRAAADWSKSVHAKRKKGGQKWSPAQHAKYRKTMAAKAAKITHTNNVSPPTSLIGDAAKAILVAAKVLRGTMAALEGENE
jgi:hypothetical protein